MFSCALHNWFSYDFPCPACQKEITSTTNIIINTDGTNATEYHPEDTIKQLQQTLKEKDREIEFKDRHIKMCKAEWDGWKEKAEQLQQLLSEKEKEIESLNEILSQKMELLVKANEEIERLKFIIAQRYDTERESWQQFKTENNL